MEVCAAIGVRFLRDDDELKQSAFATARTAGRLARQRQRIVERITHHTFHILPCERLQVAVAGRRRHAREHARNRHQIEALIRTNVFATELLEQRQVERRRLAHQPAGFQRWRDRSCNRQRGQRHGEENCAARLAGRQSCWQRFDTQTESSGTDLIHRLSRPRMETTPGTI